MERKPLHKIYDWRKSYDKQVEDNLVYIADFETSTANCEWYRKQKELDKNFHDSRITYWYAKLLKPNPKFKNDYEGCNPQSFKEFLKSLTKDTTIYFHNLSFDGRFIIKSVLERWNLKDLKPNGKPNKLIPKLNVVKLNRDEKNNLVVDGFEKVGDKWELKRNYYYWFRNGKTTYKIELKIRNNQGNAINITFRCSLQMLKSGVEALGNGLKAMKEYSHLVKYKEGENNNDFYNVEPMDNLEAFKKAYPAYVDYCKRDVEIVRVSMLVFNQTISELPTIKNYLQKEKNKEYNAFRQAMTIAGLGRHIMGGQYVKVFQQGYTITEDAKKIFNQEQYDKYNRNIQLKEDRPMGSMILQDYYENSFFKDYITWDGEEFDGTNGKGANKFYLGGFVQFNTKLQRELTDIDKFKRFKLTDGIKLDVKSAYPFQMTKPMPYGPIFEEDEFNEQYLNLNPHWIEGEDYIEWLEIRCKSITPKEIAKYCPIINNTYKYEECDYKDERYITGRQEKVVLCVCRKLWDEYNHWYDIEVEKVGGIIKYYQLAAPYLRGAALEIYNVKEYKYGKKDANGNKLYPAQQNCVKVLVNSLYGSLAMKPDYNENIVVDNDTLDYLLDNKENKLLMETKGQIKTFHYAGKSELNATADYKEASLDVDFDMDNKQCFNASAPTLITQYERLYLFETIRKIGAQYFAYSDTDSIVFYNFPPEVRAKIIELSKIKPLEHLNTNLGQWEIENWYIKEFKADKAKQYWYTIYKTDNNGNLLNSNNEIVYNKEEAATKTGFKIAGGRIEKGGADDDFIIALNEKDGNYWTFDNYKDWWANKGFEVDKKDYEEFQNGSLVLLEGDKVMERTPSGWLLKIKKKIIKKGKQ